MSEFRIEAEDILHPVRITHYCEKIWDGDTLQQNYNYLLYEFEIGPHRYQARSYLDDIDTVAVYGPFAKGSASNEPLAGADIDQQILAYLRRRYTKIDRFGPGGYVPIEASIG